MMPTVSFRILFHRGYADTLTLNVVLTKVVVYAGIGFISCEGMPLFFSLIGWGTKAW